MIKMFVKKVELMKQELVFLVFYKYFLTFYTNGTNECASN